jgi:soluble lytic murein transglycosylase-like protein
MAGKREQLRALARQKAKEANIPSGLFEALVEIESSYRPNAVSGAGAHGLSQIMPATAKGMGFIGTNKELLDPETNLALGAQYLRKLLDQTGNWEMAAAAYNAGPGAVRRHSGVPPYPETQRYLAKLRKLYNPALTVPPLPKAPVLRNKLRMWR